MGKIYKMIRPGKRGIRVAGNCVRCGLCAKACPFGFSPPGEAKDGVFRNPDCLLCGRCAARCPKQALNIERVNHG